MVADATIGEYHLVMYFYYNVFNLPNQISLYITDSESSFLGDQNMMFYWRKSFVRDEIVIDWKWGMKGQSDKEKLFPLG